MRIALVTPYDLATSGGVNSHVRQLHRQLQRLGHEATVIGPTSERITREPGTILAPGRVLPLSANGSSARIGVSPQAFAWMGTVLARGRFDLVHVHEPLVPVLPLAALMHADGPTVGTFHAHYAGTRLHSLARPFLRPFFARLDARIVVSRAALRSANEQFRDGYRVVPLGIDVERFAGAAPLPEFLDGRLNVLFVGRLDERKGVDHLLRAFATLTRAVDGVRLLLVGPGDDGAVAKYRELMASLGLSEDQVSYLGPVPDSDLARYYATADIFCSPALGSESFGMVLLEAMAAGKPAVASRILGYCDIVRDGREGLTVTPGDHDALAAALIILADHPELRLQMGQAGRRRVKRYAWSRVLPKILDVYEEAMAEYVAKAA